MLRADAGKDATIERLTKLLESVREALDDALGDTDPVIDDEAADEEVRDEYPVFWACQQYR